MFSVSVPYNVSNVTSTRNAFTDILVHRVLDVKHYEQPSITKTPHPDQLAVDEEVQEIVSEQSGEGIFDIAASVMKGVSKVSNLWKKASTMGKAVGNLARGEVGTSVSNMLSRKFNKNPNWKPGFPGESHLVLPTSYGLTRANWAGPGTNLEARMARGDLGVDGPRGIDIASKTHDMLYHHAKTKQDIRDADNRLIQEIRDGSQGPKMKSFAVKMLQAKKFGEDTGVFDAETFTKLPQLKGKGLLPAEMLKQKLRRQGYTFPRKGKHNVSSRKRSPQRGGQIAFLAGLAANLIVPAIIKAISKKKKKKKKYHYQSD